MELTAEPLVSIVIPVFNEEEHLSECIESVLGQTYERWECTIVDNRSTDRSLEIAQEYAARDSRIQVHNNSEFLEMLENHNAALRLMSAESKYCKVVLSDDFIYPDCLEKMVAVAEAYPSVGIVSSYQLHGNQVRSAGLPYSQQLVSGREACRLFLLQELILFGTQTSVLYRSDLVRSRDPFYIETDMCADFEACFALLSNTDLGFVHQVLTYSRTRPSSIGRVSSDTGANNRSLLDILLKYGGECLSKSEYRDCLKRQLAQYYEFLGRRLWVEHDKAFWDFHKKALADTGIGFSYLRVVLAAVMALGNAVLSPRAAIERIKRLVVLRRIRVSQMRSVVSGFERVSVGEAGGSEHERWKT
jgi:glycosyltransferase involved in cell wall biosynthesis